MRELTELEELEEKVSELRNEVNSLKEEVAHNKSLLGKPTPPSPRYMGRVWGSK